MSSMHGGDIAIVGAAETDRIGKLPGHSMLALHAEAARNALADAGIGPKDVDGLAAAEPLSVEVSHHLGITPRWLDGTNVGGGSFLLHVRHAAAAIAAGAADVVLITHGESGRSRIGAAGFAGVPSSPQGQFEWPYGAIVPHTSFTVPALRFLHDRGLDRRALAEVVVAQRAWAMDNPRAWRREKVTVDDVLGDETVSYPFTKQMCCVVTDGGGALVLTSRRRAADLRRPPVHVLGSGESAEALMVSQLDDLSSSHGFRRSSAEAFATARVSPEDIDHLMVYDAFAHLPLYGLEDLGFVGRGESAGFVADGHTGVGGTLPMNTNGGGLSYTHTGKYGMFAILESVRQLRREAVVQVPGVELSFVQGVGMYFASAASLVLSNAVR